MSMFLYPHVLWRCILLIISLNRTYWAGGWCDRVQCHQNNEKLIRTSRLFRPATAAI